MSDQLPVHVNREELHALEVPASFEAHDSFDVALVNHGESLHVHVHLDDALSQVASIDATNHYVERESTRAVRVTVDEAALAHLGDVHGKIKVASAYGAQTRWIDVDLSEYEEEDDAVQVDESLAQPQPTPEEPGTPLLQRPELPVLALGGLALVVALLAAVLINNTFVLVGSLVVLAGVLVALYFLLAG
ncbi:hypothetical protein ACKVMT_06430 [Halobacteriales archaeon Cl-PHB]